MNTIRAESDGDVKAENKIVGSKTKIVLEYLKILTWPIIVLFLIFKFASPIEDILNEVPNILGKADSIEIWKVKVSINKVLAKKASPEIRKILKELDENDIEEILELGKIEAGETVTFTQTDSTNIGVKRYLNWTQLGLVSRLSDKELKEYAKKENSDLPDYGFSENQALVDTREFLISFIPNILSQQK